MELLLIRHALPAWSEGADTMVDPPLSPAGQAQAAALARRLDGSPVHEIHASPLVRARETADALAKQLGLITHIDPDLAEMELDGVGYVPIEELRRTEPARWTEIVAGLGDLTDAQIAFRRRVMRCLDTIVHANPSRTVAVVCHGGTINATLGSVLATPGFWIVELGYTSVTRLAVSRDGTWSVLSVNDTNHLEPTRASPAPGSQGQAAERGDHAERVLFD